MSRCANCDCGMSNFSMFWDENSLKYESKYGKTCSFTCSVAIHDKDIDNHPENYEWVSQKTSNGNTISFYAKKVNK